MGPLTTSQIISTTTHHQPNYIHHQPKYIHQHTPLPGIFPSTFLQPVNGNNDSILNLVLKLSLFMRLFFLFLKHTWKIFYSIHLFFLLLDLDITSTNKGKLYVSF